MTYRESLQGALGVSLVSHALAALLVMFVLSGLPTGGGRSTQTAGTLPLLAWVPEPGTPHGGGGSGHQQREPARPAEMPGRDPLTAAAETGSRLTDISTEQVQIPAIPMNAGARELPGVTTNVAAALTDALGAGVGDRAGQGRGSGNGAGDGPGFGPGRDGGFGGEAYQPGNGVIGPFLIHETKPAYTAEAMRARIQGVVRLQAIVMPDGSVGRVRVVDSLDRTFGLDDSAITSVKSWRFLPGMRAGRAVPVVVEIELLFTLR